LDLVEVKERLYADHNMGMMAKLMIEGYKKQIDKSRHGHDPTNDMEALKFKGSECSCSFTQSV
jgi:hypothetical protein